MIPFELLDTAEGINRLTTSLERRGLSADLLTIAVAARSDGKRAVTALNDARSQLNKMSADFGQRKKAGEPTDDLTAQIKKVKLDIETYEAMVRDNGAALHNTAALIPNLVDVFTPDGMEPKENPSYAGTTPVPSFAFEPKTHEELGVALGLLDFEQAAVMSGSRFAILRGPLAKLERVLGQWMVDHAVEHGFEEVAVPHLVQQKAMFGTGQLPKFEEDLFRAGDHYLIPTAEVPLTNQFADRVTVIDDFDNQRPWAKRFCALTPCYRAEAGSAGRDTRGLMRMHQFNKCELVSVCHPDAGDQELHNMTSVACSVLQKLGLPFRVMTLAAQDIGFSAMRTFDLEVWVPAQNQYREISSVSLCGDFQARRMNARYKFKGTNGTSFPSTLNGSGVAVGRALLAIMENYQTAQGGIAIPQVLRERMGGSLIAPDGTLV